MTTDLERVSEAAISAQTMELVLQNDLAKLTPKQRVEYYLARCAAAGLDPRTKPFDYIVLSGKLTLYANKTAAEQAAFTRSLSLDVIARERLDDLYVVTVRVSDPTGRRSESIGAVAVQGLKGDGLANALMKAETKAKRRAVLAFCGLGILDETETDTIPGAQRVVINTETGEVLETIPALPCETQATYSEAAGLKPDTESQQYNTLVQTFARLWKQQDLKGNGDAKRAYCARVLGRSLLTTEENLEGAIGDWRLVVADLEDRPTALKHACAAYGKTGANASDGDTMRAEIARSLGCPPFESRNELTASELRRFAELCTAQAQPADPDGGLEFGEPDPFEEDGGFDPAASTSFKSALGH